MQPVTPVIPGIDLPVTIYAKGQPEYISLPCYRFDDGTVITRWKLTWKERLQILLHGNLWLSILTFNRPLQPVKPETQCPNFGMKGGPNAHRQ